MDSKPQSNADFHVEREPRNARIGRCVGLLSLALLLAASAGCSIRNDPSANRFRPREEDLRLMSRARQYERVADQALDNLDERLENILH